ncbi:MAG: alpha/beta hydrolase [Kiritimatiellia bacterium]
MTRRRYLKTRSIAVAAAVAGMLAAGAAVAAPVPTHSDVSYSGKYKRSTLDFWQAESEGPAPLVIYFHGGAFRTGDKSSFRKSKLLSRYYPKGISFASVNYPFLESASYGEIVEHVAKAVQFLKDKAPDWNIDVTRIAVAGASSGAVICEYLTYWKELDITCCFAIEQPSQSEFLLAGIENGEAPLVVYTRSRAGDAVHDPEQAKIFKKHCDTVGVKCEIYGTGDNGLPAVPDGETIEDIVMECFYRCWK